MQLKNKTEREKFLENYKAWGLWFECSQIEMKYYRFMLPDGVQIIVSEHTVKYWNYEVKANIDKVNVKYHIVIPGNIKWPSTSYTNGNEFKHFNPNGCGITTIVKYLTETKPEIEL